MKNKIIIFLGIFLLCWSRAYALQKTDPVIHGVYAGMPQEEFLRLYPQNRLRNYRHEALNDWLTYNKPIDDPLHELVTFYFHNKLWSNGV